MTTDTVNTSVFPKRLDWKYPSIEHANGVWLHTDSGHKILDACSGGLVVSLGYGVAEIVDSAAKHAGDLTYMYNHFFTNEPRERLAHQLLEVVAPEMGRVKFTSGGSEANEAALRLARQYHVDSGESQRWKIITPAQAYHGATMATLALTGRPSLQKPFDPYLQKHLHIPPSTGKFDPTGQAALDALDAALERAGPENVAAFFCEPISASALPAYSPPNLFWEGLSERRDRHGFLICFDEIATGIARTGDWLAYQSLPIEPDIVTIGNTLGAGYAPLAAMLCREHIYSALAAGSKEFDLGHTWDGAPLPCSVGLAVLSYIIDHQLIDRVATRGPALYNQLEAATCDSDIVRLVRGKGFLLGVEYVDPRDGESHLPPSLDVASMVDASALGHDLLVLSSHTSVDGFTDDQTVIAPAFTSNDKEQATMIERFAWTITDVERAIKDALATGGAR